MGTARHSDSSPERLRRPGDAQSRLLGAAAVLGALLLAASLSVDLLGDDGSGVLLRLGGWQ